MQRNAADRRSVSLLAQTVEAIKDALRLADDVHRASDTLKDLTEQRCDHDRRITRLKAQWETAALMSRRRLEGAQGRERQCLFASTYERRTAFIRVRWPSPCRLNQSNTSLSMRR
jgi:hypothetical protein